MNIKAIKTVATNQLAECDEGLAAFARRLGEDANHAFERADASMALAAKQWVWRWVSKTAEEGEDQLSKLLVSFQDEVLSRARRGGSRSTSPCSDTMNHLRLEAIADVVEQARWWKIS